MRFRIFGDPVGKDRPRFRVVPKRGGGHYVQTYTPKKTAEWEQEIGEQVGVMLARLRAAGLTKSLNLPFSKRILVTMRTYIQKPASAPKKEVHRIKKPDVDNYAKALLDALEKIALIEDDKTVTDLYVTKRYASDANPPGIDVEITAWI